MARIFITGSADGLGQLAAALLVKQGHEVVLHARNAERGKEAMAKVPGAQQVLIADLSDMNETKQLAEEANKTGYFDAVIHNAGVLRVAGDVIFRVNTLAPYILTCLMERSQRIVYLSSGMHQNGNPRLTRLQFERGSVSYFDSKLHDLILSKAVARKWKEVYSNAVNPGWVPTKMGGTSAPDDLEKGAETQAWLAVSDEAKVKVSGIYFCHQREDRYLQEADNTDVQDIFLSLCEKETGVQFPVG